MRLLFVLWATVLVANLDNAFASEVELWGQEFKKFFDKLISPHEKEKVIHDSHDSHDSHDKLDFDDKELALLSKLFGKDVDIDLDLDDKSSKLKSSELLKVLPLLFEKGNVELEKFDFDENLWKFLKGLGAAEFSKIFPLLLAKSNVFDNKKLKQIDLGKFEIDDDLWKLFKSLDSNEFLKLLPILIATATLLHHNHNSHELLDLDLGAKAAGSIALAGILPILLTKAKFDTDIFHLDDHTWNGIKGLNAAEAAKILPLLVGGKLAGDVGHDLKHDFHLDETLWTVIKGLGAAGAAKILPLLLHGKTKIDLDLPFKGKHDLGGSLLKDGLFGDAKSGLLGHHDLDLGIDASVWGLLKTLDAVEAAKVLPILLGKDKLEFFGLGHGLIHIDEKIWALLKGLEVAEAVKLLPLVLGLAAKSHEGLGHEGSGFEGINIAEAVKLFGLLISKGDLELDFKDKFDLDKVLGKGGKGTSLFKLDDSLWALLKKLKPAELATVLPLLIGKEKLELLGLSGEFIINDQLWEFCKGLEAPQFIKLLPQLFGKGKSHIDDGFHKDNFGPLIKTFSPHGDHIREINKDYLYDQLRYQTASVYADDCFDCYYDDRGYYYTY